LTSGIITWRLDYGRKSDLVDSVGFWYVASERDSRDGRTKTRSEGKTHRSALRWVAPLLVRVAQRRFISFPRRFVALVANPPHHQQSTNRYVTGTPSGGVRVYYSVRMGVYDWVPARVVEAVKGRALEEATGWVKRWGEKNMERRRRADGEEEEGMEEDAGFLREKQNKI